MEGRRRTRSCSTSRSCSQVGIGRQEARTGRAVSDAPVVSCVVMTESEYRTLMARRRGSRKYQSSQPGARESLLTSTPFVDRWRIDHAMYRPASKEQWLSPDGFKTAC